MDSPLLVPKLRAPVVLVHGLFGFDAFRIMSRELVPYFRGIRGFLSQSGNRIHTARLSATARIATRAEQLKAFIEKASPNEPVHVIAHSMGGLDTRYMIAKLGMADRILSLTTLGTPHRGTSFADWGLERWGILFRPPYLPGLTPVPALLDLTRESATQFNAEIKDDPRVRYFSVAGRFFGKWWQPNFWWSSRVIHRHEGENDGLVSVESARYGEAFDLWDGDHLSLVNWPTVQGLITLTWYDRRQGYAHIMRRLHDCGF